MKFIDREYLLRQLVNFNRDILDVLYVKNEQGKGLSSNDFTAEEKEKLERLENYDDSELRSSVEAINATLSGKVDSEEGKGLSANDFTTEEKFKLEGLENYDDEEIRSEIASLFGEIESILKELDVMKGNEFFSISCENRNISIQLKNETSAKTDISGIFAETSIEELKDVSGKGKQDGTSLVYDETLGVWKPQVIDLDGAVSEAKAYSDGLFEDAKEYSDSLSTENKSYAESILEQAKSYSDETISDRIAEIIADAPEDLDTLKEISDWISSHADDASAMNSQINQNSGEIEGLKETVSGKANSVHSHSADDITSGTLSVTRGGTGGTTAKAAEFNIIGEVETVETIPVDDRYIALRNLTVSNTNGSFRWTKCSSIWAYIKSKITGDNIVSSETTLTSDELDGIFG